MSDLTDKALEDVVIEIAKLCAERGVILSVSPRRLLIPRDSTEDDEEYAKKVASAQRIVARLKGD